MDHFQALSNISLQRTLDPSTRLLPQPVRRVKRR